MRSLLYIDLETGGLDPLRHSVLQIGLGFYRNDELHCDSFYVCEDNPSICPEASMVHGITTRKIKAEGLTPRRATRRIRDFMTGHGVPPRPHMCGWNIEFDRSFMRRLFRQASQPLDSEGRGKFLEEFEELFSYRSVNLFSIARYLVDRGVLASFDGLLGACEILGVTVEKPHDALSDMIGAFEVHQALMAVELTG